MASAPEQIISSKRLSLNRLELLQARFGTVIPAQTIKDLAAPVMVRPSLAEMKTLATTVTSKPFLFRAAMLLNDLARRAGY